MMELHLEAETRNSLGRAASKAIRKMGKVPAVAYAKGLETICIALPEKPLTLLYETGRLFNTKVTLSINGSKLAATVRDASFHPVKDSITHLDLQVAQDKCKVKIPVRFLGADVCPGIKKGGFLNKIQRFIWVSCASDSIPQSIDFDISQLEAGQTVRFSDTTLLPDCSILPSKRGDVVASILSKR